LRPGQRRITRIRVKRPGVWAGAGGVGVGEVVDVLSGFGTDCELLAVTADGGLRYSADCGTSWTALKPPVQDQRVVAAECDRAGWVHLRTAGGAVVKIKLGAVGDVEQVVTLAANGATATASGLDAGEVYWVAGGKLFASVQEGRVRSVTLPVGGRAVIDVATDALHGRSCVVLDDGALLCGTRDSEWRRTGRVSATMVSAGAKLTLDPWREDVMYLAIPGERVLQSLSGGRHWRPLGTAPALAAGGGRSLFFGRDATSKRVCIATTDGLVCSDDDGFSWVAPGVGLEALRGAAPIVVDSDDGTLLVARTGGDVYKLRPIEDREFVSAQVYFASGVAEPKARLVPLLEQIGGRLGRDAGLRLRVEGHTDSDGDDASNQELSERRAAAVQRILLKNGGRPEQVVTFGYGESRPLRPNTIAANKQANRRVELITYH